MGLRDREDNRDANPMVNALPAQVVRRRGAVVSREEKEGDVVSIDRKIVFAMKPDIRAKWLNNALVQIAQEEMTASDIYPIIKEDRFIDGVQPKLGQKMARSVLDRIDLFSAKQKRALGSEVALTVKFGTLVELPTKVQPQAPAASSTSGPESQEMMDRCRAFMREKMVERGEIHDKDGKAKVSSSDAKEAKTQKESNEGSKSGKEKEQDSKKAKEKEKVNGNEKEKDKDKEKEKEKEKEKDKDKQKDKENNRDRRPKSDTKVSKDGGKDDKSSSSPRRSRVRRRQRSSDSSRRRKRKRSSSSGRRDEKRKKSQKKSSNKGRRKKASSSSESASSSTRRSSSSDSRKKKRRKKEKDS